MDIVVKKYRLGDPQADEDTRIYIAGPDWDEIWANRSPGVYGDQPVPYIGREQFIKAKRAAGRLQDLADVEKLGAAP